MYRPFFFACLLVLCGAGCAALEAEKPSSQLHEVVKVVDGDTIDVSIDGTIERLRLIGINTPETVDPRKPVECFGMEASQHAKELLTGSRVRLEADPSQGERDKYGRLLRYVYLSDDKSFNLAMIFDGYAYEYTYGKAYTHQAEYQAAERQAKAAKAGLWADDACAGKTEATATAPKADDGNVASIDDNGECVIKGNISSGDKRYHLPSCASYDVTVIDESKGERWFCSEGEAQAEGWVKAGNCP